MPTGRIRSAIRADSGTPGQARPSESTMKFQYVKKPRRHRFETMLVTSGALLRPEILDCAQE
jgi:hypothetical protein